MYPPPTATIPALRANPVRPKPAGSNTLGNSNWSSCFNCSSTYLKQPLLINIAAALPFRIPTTYVVNPKAFSPSSAATGPVIAPAYFLVYY